MGGGGNVMGLGVSCSDGHEPPMGAVLLFYIILKIALTKFHIFDSLLPNIISGPYIKRR
jgi:hypothetical protein